MPWKTIAEVPAGIKKHKGAELSLEQANKWAEIFDSLKANASVSEPAAAAWSTWEEIYELKDGAWVTRKREAAESMLWVEDFAEAIDVLEKDREGLPSKVRVLVIAEGEAKTKNRVYPKAPLQALAKSGMLDNLKMYDQHIEGSEAIKGAIFKARSMRDYLSYIVPGTSQFVENIKTRTGQMVSGITAVVKLIDRDFKYKVAEAAETMGLSLTGLLDALQVSGKDVVQSVRKVVSLDWLTGEPNCGGQVLEFVEAADAGGSADKLTNIRVRIAEPGDFQEGAMEDGATFSTIDIPGVKGVSSVVGKLKGAKGTSAQNFMFDPADWTVEEAKKWVEQNGHKVIRVDLIRGKEVTEQMEWKDITAEELKKNRPDLVTSLTSAGEAQVKEAETKVAEAETKAAAAETKATEAETKATEATTAKDQAVAESAKLKKELEDKTKEFSESAATIANAGMITKTIEAVESKCAGLSVLGKAQVMKAVIGKTFTTEKEMAEAIDAEVAKQPQPGVNKSTAPAAGGDQEPALPSGSQAFAESIGLSESEIKRISSVR